MQVQVFCCVASCSTLVASLVCGRVALHLGASSGVEVTCALADRILPPAALLQEMQPTYAVTVDGIECAFFDQVGKLQHFGSVNRESIAELLWAFFSYWAYHHDYANDVISVRTGGIIR